MKTCFYTICSDSHWKGCRADEFIQSFQRFHGIIPLVVFKQADIDREFKEHPELNFFNSKAHFARLLYNDYDLVVNMDIDHLVLGTLDSILKADYDVACPANYNTFSNAFLKIMSTGNNEYPLIPETHYFQGGLIASTKKKFWDDYHFASMKHSQNLHYKENDVLNLVLAFNNYKTKYLDGAPVFRDADFHSYYGCASLGREKQVIVSGDGLTLDGKPVKAYHFARSGINKIHPKELFTPEVVEFIYTKIVV